MEVIPIAPEVAEQRDCGPEAVQALLFFSLSTAVRDHPVAVIDTRMHRNLI